MPWIKLQLSTNTHLFRKSVAKLFSQKQKQIVLCSTFCFPLDCLLFGYNYYYFINFLILFFSFFFFFFLLFFWGQLFPFLEKLMKRKLYFWREVDVEKSTLGYPFLDSHSFHLFLGTGKKLGERCTGRTTSAQDLF